MNVGYHRTHEVHDHQGVRVQVSHIESQPGIQRTFSVDAMIRFTIQHAETL